MIYRYIGIYIYIYIYINDVQNDPWAFSPGSPKWPENRLFLSFLEVSFWRPFCSYFKVILKVQNEVVLMVLFRSQTRGQNHHSFIRMHRIMLFGPLKITGFRLLNWYQNQPLNRSQNDLKKEFKTRWFWGYFLGLKREVKIMHFAYTYAQNHAFWASQN